jgi:hypothetical protein
MTLFEKKKFILYFADFWTFWEHKSPFQCLESRLKIVLKSYLSSFDFLITILPRFLDIEKKYWRWLFCTSAAPYFSLLSGVLINLLCKTNRKISCLWALRTRTKCQTKSQSKLTAQWQVHRKIRHEKRNFKIKRTRSVRGRNLRSIEWHQKHMCISRETFAFTIITQNTVHKNYIFVENPKCKKLMMRYFVWHF